MKKPGKKRIEEVAKKLFAIWLGSEIVTLGMAQPYAQLAFTRMAKYVLTELQPSASAARWPKSTFKPIRAKAPGPKSCKVVRGKTVCK
jgi:hypothetical protein